MPKTGEVFDRREDGSLWLAESFETSEGVVSTTQTALEEASFQSLMVVSDLAEITEPSTEIVSFFAPEKPSLWRRMTSFFTGAK